MKTLTAILCIFFFACSNTKVKPKNSVDFSADSKVIDTIQEDAEPDYRQEYIESYDKKISLDTLFIQEGTKYRIIFKHYCTMDSNLLVPAKYNFDTKKDFVTHNFNSVLIWLQEKDTLLKKQIVKSDFNPVLYSELKQYAILKSPILEIKNDSIFVHYSISIPVTDVGIAATIKFDKNGKFKVENN